ncbi:MAG: MBL fold metallo-hydrolase [Ruminococcaceae bacterium]|nr:MBL fold metallo-hydrolase [Oscillospiraceae bacterium]
MRKLATFAFSFAAAVFLAVYFLPTEYVLYIAVALAVLCCVGPVLKNDFGKRLTIILLAAALGLTWFSAYNALFRSPAAEYNGETMRISAEVTDYSEVYDYGTRVQANVVIDSKSYKSLVYFYGQSLELIPGDILSSNAELTLADTIHREPTLYYAANGYTLKAAVFESPNILHPESTPLKYYPAKVSKAFEGMLDNIYPEFESSFMKALLLGKDQYVPEDFMYSMERTGLTHVFVVSGLHIGFLISIISLLARRRRLTAAVSIPVILFFSAMSGFTPSVCRASLMYIMVISAPLFYRDSDGLTNISLALLLLLLLNPLSIANMALQLSFACCIGICLFSPSIYRWISAAKPVVRIADTKLCSTKAGHYVLNFIKSSLCSSFGVLVPSVPIIALYYGTVCVISPLSNLLTLWAFSLCFTTGMLILSIAFLSSGLGSLLTFIPSVLIRYISGMVSLLSNIPFATIHLDFFAYKIWLVFVYIVIVLSIVFKNKRPFVQIVCCILTFAAACLVNNMYISTSDLTFTALDVGQGQCLVANSRGETIVIDCGGTKSPDSALKSHLNSLGSDHIDMLIVTHFHSDHAEYIPEIISSFEVDTVVIPDVVDETGMRYEIIQAAKTNKCDTVILKNDALVDFGSSSIEIFAPMGGETANEECLSMVISHENYDILVTADMNIDLENLLIATRDLPNVELLVAGHHGSRLSTGEKLLRTVDPETAIISVGYNSYGHPSDETLYRLEAFGVSVMRTDESGNITIRK